MTGVTPVQLLPFAGLLGLIFAGTRLSKPTSNGRLVVDVLIIGFATIAACAGAWTVYWWIEQRW